MIVVCLVLILALEERGVDGKSLLIQLESRGIELMSIVMLCGDVKLSSHIKTQNGFTKILFEVIVALWMDER